MVALFIALMFVGCILVDFVVQSLQTRRAAVSAPAGLPLALPVGLNLTDGHTWSRPDSSVGVKIGADALLAHAMGAVEKVVLPETGQLVKAGELLFNLDYRGRTLRVPSPITGRVVASNPGLVKRPELIVREPYGAGWICAITPTEAGDQTAGVRSGERATIWLEEEFHRFREFLSRQVAPDLALSVTYPDGGLPAIGALDQLARSGWDAFEVEFLRLENRAHLVEPCHHI